MVIFHESFKNRDYFQTHCNNRRNNSISTPTHIRVIIFSIHTCINV